MTPVMFFLVCTCQELHNMLLCTDIFCSQIHVCIYSFCFQFAECSVCAWRGLWRLSVRTSRLRRNWRWAALTRGGPIFGRRSPSGSSGRTAMPRYCTAAAKSCLTANATLITRTGTVPVNFLWNLFSLRISPTTAARKGVQIRTLVLNTALPFQSRLAAARTDSVCQWTSTPYHPPPTWFLFKEQCKIPRRLLVWP